MKNYSFSNIANEDTYNPKRNADKSGIYRFQDMKSSDANIRIEEIKKKYDTPSRRQRIESLKKSKDFEFKENHAQPRFSNAMSNGSNALKESFAVNRIQKIFLKNDLESKQFVTLRGLDQDGFRKLYESRQSDFPAMKSNYREQEQAIFSKMREMKQSLINNDYMRSSINPKSSGYYQRNATYGERLSTECAIKNKDIDFDPRVQNIDKINNKIKQILSCLTQNQKKPIKYSKQDTNNSTKNDSNNKESAFFGSRHKKEESDFKKNYQAHSYKKSDVVSKINVYQFKEYEQKQKIDEPQKLIQPNQQLQKQKAKIDLTYDRISADLRKARQAREKGDYSVSKNYKVPEKNPLTSTPNHYLKKNEDLKASRSRSYIDSIKKSGLEKKKDEAYLLNSGKKLNDEISKIQNKIEQFEREKKKLNIQFTPFSAKTRSTSNLAVVNKVERLSEFGRNVNMNKEDEIQTKQQKPIDVNYKRQMRNEIKKQANLYNLPQTKNYYEGMEKNIQRNEFDLKIQNIEVKTVRVNNQVQNNEEININSGLTEAQELNQLNSYEIKRKTDEGIEERKKKLLQNDEIIQAESVKKLVSLFCEQTKLDQNYRNAKIWLEGCMSPNKYVKISELLAKHKIKKTPEDCETEFNVHESEHNPFFSTAQFEGSLQNLVESYIASKTFWETKIHHRFARSGFIADNFSAQKIDLQRKGFIQLQDLVRFLNIESGTFYRNRDVYLILHRFTKANKVNFEGIMNEICYPE